MAHDRERHAGLLLQKLLGFSPIVAVFGHRQVGKTTLLSSCCKEYVTLDSSPQRARMEADPISFVSGVSRHPFGIDEAQYVPSLFPALKEHVRTHKRPGQFLLSGSVRFTSRRAIRESLTGRIVFLELLPFTQAEMDRRPLNDAAFEALNGRWENLGKAAEKSGKSHRNPVRNYLQTGGLPGVCFIRSARLRAERLESQLETMLDRDLRLIWETRLPFVTLRNVLVNLALSQGQPLELQDLGRRTRISVPTLKRILWAFESIFLIRRLPTEGTEKRPVVFLEDQGEATHLLERPLDPVTELTRFLFAQVRVPLALGSDQLPRFFQYRTRGGAFVPLACRLGRKTIGFLPIAEPNPGKQAMGSAVSFVRSNPGAKIVFVNPDDRFQVISKEMANVPVALFG